MVRYIDSSLVAHKSRGLELVKRVSLFRPVNGSLKPTHSPKGFLGRVSE